jgi:hypothetical protein
MGRVSYAMLLIAAASTAGVQVLAKQSKQPPASSSGTGRLVSDDFSLTAKLEEFLRQLGRQVEIVGTDDFCASGP